VPPRAHLFAAEVKGLNDFPKDTHPPVAIVHFAFQIMVGCGMLMMAIAVWSAWRFWRGRRDKSKMRFDSKWFLRARSRRPARFYSY